MDSREEIVHSLADRIKESGGRAFYVGGYVRDKLTDRQCKDIDIEVYGIEKDQLLSTLCEFGKVDSCGENYGIYALCDLHIDVALPRTERCIGKGHKDFEVTVNPYLDFKSACRRRDFTINAMLMDVLSGEIVDPYGGLSDLRDKVIRHMDDMAFTEDPLRVLRACQFAARFDCRIADKTLCLCRSMDITTLHGQRVADEMNKALLKALRPSLFFECLSQMDHLRYWFPELEKLQGLQQDPIYHPEGDVWIHTMQVVDRAAQKRDRCSEPLGFMLLSLLHDVGKITTTFVRDGRIHSYGHETQSLPQVKEFVTRFGYDRRIEKYLMTMIPLHMKPNILLSDKSSVKSFNTMFDQTEYPDDLILFSTTDRYFPPSEAQERETLLRDRLSVYREYMSRPYVTGKDLLDAGLKPSEEFTRLLSMSHKMRLAGVDRDSALKQILSSTKK